MCRRVLPLRASLLLTFALLHDVSAFAGDQSADDTTRANSDVESSARRLETCLEVRGQGDEGYNRLVARYSDIALPILQEALKHGDRTRQARCLRLLKSVAPEGREMVPLLLPFLGDTDSAICANAAVSLGLYGDAARAAVPRLLKLIAADNARSRLAASEALARIGIEANQIANLWPGVLRIEDSNNNYDWFYPFGHAAASPGRDAVPELIGGCRIPMPAFAARRPMRARISAQ